MHPLVNAAAVATGQLCVDLLSLVDSLDAGLTLDPGGVGREHFVRVWQV